MKAPKAEYELEEHRSEVRRRTKQPPVESLDSILAKFGLAFHKAMPSSVGGHREIRAATQQIERLIQTSNRDVVLKQGVHHAAEMSILDQEIMSLKAEIKRLQTLTKEDDNGEE